ncbi:MAG: hypothetical protein J4G05_00275 [Chlorobi bacterium]|nr:hypothetical protein [Chlorobiota bacterium]
MRSTKAIIIAIVTGIIILPGCQTIRDAANALNSLKQLQFKLGDVHNFQAGGIDISKLSSPSNLSVIDGLKVLNAYNSKKFPVSFALDVLTKNPNTGTSTNEGTDLIIKRLEWNLYIDDKMTINGVASGWKIPGTGETVTNQLIMNLDLLQFFADKGYDDLFNLAFAIGGVSGSSSRLKLTARVTVDMPFRDVTYPDELTIVNASFTN